MSKNEHFSPIFFLYYSYVHTRLGAFLPTVNYISLSSVMPRESLPYTHAIFHMDMSSWQWEQKISDMNLMVEALHFLYPWCNCDTSDRKTIKFFLWSFSKFLLCWRYIVEFLKLTILHIFHGCIHPLKHSPLSPTPPYLE
jgi:hypothetical protein